MSAIFLKLSNFAAAVGRVVAAVSAAIGIFAFGVWFSSKDSENLVSDAEQRGFQRGLSEANILNSSNEHQTEVLAKLLSIVQSDQAALEIPESYRKGLSDSIGAAQKGQFDQAESLLPIGVSVSPLAPCVPINDRLNLSFNVDAHVRFCETDTDIFLESVQGSGQVWLLIDGNSEPLSLGKYFEFSKECWVGLEKIETNSDLEKAELSFECKKKG